MEPAQKVVPSDWMLLKSACKILAALNTDCSEPQALFVGGCVRNFLLNKETQDLDIATIHTPDVVEKLCKKHKFKTIPTGIDHGTITAIVDGKSFEITTLRRDVETNGRRATVAFTSDWKEDAARRDFTMNTLLADLDGHIYDPLGSGISDLTAKKVKFVGKPSERILEDYLRILRFFRFHAYYGSTEIDRDALAACKKHSDHINDLSKERISQEFFKILMAPDMVKTLDLMKQNRITANLLAGDFSHLSRLVKRQEKYDLPHLSARLFLLLGGSDYKIEWAAENYFIFSNQQKKFFEGLIKLTKNMAHYLPVRELIYREGVEVAGQFLLMSVNDHDLDDVIDQIKNWEEPVFPINGHDAIKLGLKQNASLGNYLNQVETWWIDKEFKPNKEEALEYLKGLLG